MGNIMSWFENMFSAKNATILMVGLDAAGKTTILVKLKLNEVGETVPTIGFNVETVQYRNVTFHLWDVGGQKRLRSLWSQYYEGSNAVIFVIDSNDIARMNDAKEELERIITEPQLNTAAVLVLCNKQDLPHHLTPAQIVQQFGFRDPSTTFGRALVGRQWFVQGCCAHSGEGLFEGLDWLCNHLPNN